MNFLITGPEAMGECLEMDTDETVQANLSDGDQPWLTQRLLVLSRSTRQRVQ